jgi:translation initiation factor IF-2
MIRDIEDSPEKLVSRPPVVTVMGHVDHGKTALLDAIRETNIMAKEAGGITQHIGAYHVNVDGGSVVFLDTPGHEAFTAMRSRGAKVTDLVVLVVAADDGVMAQTMEAINHAKAAEVPIIVAINKIDKPDARPEVVKRSLADYGLVLEEWGGDTIAVEISAKERTGINELLEMIVLQSEMLDLKANPERLARGTIIESRLDKSRGPVVTLIIQKGTLHIGDTFAAGPHYGRIRAMVDDKGKSIKQAGPSMPVEIMGFSKVPVAGEEFIVFDNEKKAKELSEFHASKLREKELASSNKITLEDLFSKFEEGEIKELNLIIKGDVQGSVEAIKESVTQLSTSEIKVTIIHSGVGGINETDVLLASASDAIVVGFSVRAETKAAVLAEQEKVDLRYYNIIYDLINDIKAAMLGMLEPTQREITLGRAEVREVFNAPKVGAIAGSYVLNGKVIRGSFVRLLRDNVVMHEGKIDTLRRFKDDVKEVQSGFECGINLENYNDVKVGDVLEFYDYEEIAPTL